MKTDRKPRVDSTSERIRIMSSATTIINPPASVPLNTEETLFFDNIIREFAKADWTPHQIELVALLARTIADYKRESELLREEGAVVTGGMGSPVVNPRKQVVQMHANNIVGFRRSLALHAAAQGLKGDVAKTKALSKRFEAQSPFFDDLIARPN